MKIVCILKIVIILNKISYGRLFKECTLAIYEGLYNNFSELNNSENYYRFIGVYKDLLQDHEWKIVGNRPFKNDEEAWAPPSVVVDAITKKGSLYYKGQITPCTYDECKDLEVVAAWDRHHVVDMLMGDTKWDDSIRKPIDK